MWVNTVPVIDANLHSKFVPSGDTGTFCYKTERYIGHVKEWEELSHVAEFQSQVAHASDRDVPPQRPRRVVTGFIPFLDMVRGHRRVVVIY